MTEAAQREAAQRIGTELRRKHPELHYELPAAALTLIERGDPPREREVVAEARVRFRRLREAAIVQFERSGNKEAITEMKADIKRVCGGSTG